MIDPSKMRHNRRWSILVGTGLALSPIHNSWLTGITTNYKGETLFFLPAFGYLILIMGTGLFLLNHWDKVKEIGWGDKKVVAPLLFIVGAIALSGAAVDGWEARFAPLGMGIALFGLYLMARVVGKDIFLPLAVGAVIGSLGIIAHQLVYPGQATGGFVFERNYDIATGYILFGAALFVNRKWQWVSIALVVIALLLSGSAEAVFALGILGIVVLWRRDWGLRLAAIGIPIILLLIGLFVSGYGQSLHELTFWAATGDTQYLPADRNPDRGTAWERRWETIEQEIGDLTPLGTGYNVTNFSAVRMVHNVPLVIVQQLGWPGILAGLAWLWVSVWGLVKTRWKYAWVTLLALSVFDHYIWTQLGTLFWVLAGVSTTSDINNDLIFKKYIGDHIESETGFIKTS